MFSGPVAFSSTPVPLWHHQVINIALLCGEKETHLVYAKQYRDDEDSGIPLHIQDIWRKDVAEEQQCRISTVCNTCTFIMNKSHFPFIERWQQQMNKVLSCEVSQVTNSRSMAYAMTDESVMNSLFAFSRLAPQVHEFQLDKSDQAHSMHFGGLPKPWHTLRMKHFKYFNVIIELIDWCYRNNYQTPPLPASFRRELKYWHYSKALSSSIFANTKHQLAVKLKL